MAKQRRISTHEIETRSKDNIRALINADTRGLYRELSERDYGIDALVEVFDNGCITGKFAMIQCKGKKEEIKPLITEPGFIACPGITASNIAYLDQDNVLMILVYGSVEDRDNFYFINLKEAITDEQLEILRDETKKVTVRIPIYNNAKNNINIFFQMIDDFFNDNDN